MAKIIKISDKAIIREVEFRGFAEPVASEKCTHKRCGFVKKHFKCDTCGRFRSSYMGRPRSVCSTPVSSWKDAYICYEKINAFGKICKGTLRKRGGESVQCKSNKHFKLLNESTVANPTTKPRYIVISGRIETWHVFMIDIEKAEFLPGLFSCQDKTGHVYSIDSHKYFEIANYKDVLRVVFDLAV